MKRRSMKRASSHGASTSLLAISVCQKIGIAASGNSVGLSLEDWQALSESERHRRINSAEQELLDAGADYVIATIADARDVFVDIERRIAGGERPRP